MDNGNQKENGGKSSASHEILQRVPGAEFSSRIDAGWGMVAVVVILVILFVIGRPDPYRRIVVFVADGITITILVTVLAFVFTLVVGLIGGLGRLSRNKAVYGISTLYVEFVRGIPLLVQLLWWYFAFPVVVQSTGRLVGLPFLENYKANPVAMAILGFVVCYGAYMSEIYRAGIQSIPKGQMEAARSLGMTYFQAMRYVVLPQAVRVILPPVGNEFIALLKDSSLVSVVAVTDLTRRGREFMSQTYMPIETWFMIALLYLVLTLASARIIEWAEKKTRIER
jgi:polar amino acid transport system permease protein